MSKKNIFLYFIIVSLAISLVSSKVKFLSPISPIPIKRGSDPIAFLNEESENTPSSDSGSSNSKINIKCLYSKGYNIYSLQGLTKKKSDYTIDDRLNGDGEIIFNFCRNTHIDKGATFVRKVDNETIKLSGPIEGTDRDSNQWTETEDGVLIDFIDGDDCHENNATEKYHVSLDIICDSDVDDDEFLEDLNFTDTSNKCKYNIQMRSIHGCSLRKLYLLLKILKKYKVPFAIFMVLVGIGLCFFGYRAVKYTIIFICGVIGCYSLTALCLSLFPNFIKTENYLFLCLFVCFVLGCFVGYFVKDDINSAIFIFGAFLGYCSATFVYQIVQNYVEFDPEILYYACIGVCVVVGAIIGYKLSDPIIILGSSVLGGYFMMRGVSLVARNYLDETYVIDLIKNKEWDQLKDLRDSWIYAYLASWIILSFAGILIQCKNYKKQKSGKIEKK